MSKYENGEITLDIETLYEISRALGVPAAQLIDYRPQAQELTRPVPDIDDHKKELRRWQKLNMLIVDNQLSK